MSNFFTNFHTTRYPHAPKRKLLQWDYDGIAVKGSPNYEERGTPRKRIYLAVFQWINTAQGFALKRGKASFWVWGYPGDDDRIIRAAEKACKMLERGISVKDLIGRLPAAERGKGIPGRETPNITWKRFLPEEVPCRGRAGAAAGASGQAGGQVGD